MNTLKVSSKSQPASIAGAIAGFIKDGEHVTLQAIGAGAVNQAVKATAIARGFLVPNGIDISLLPAFSEIEIDGVTRTALKLQVITYAQSSE